MFEELKKRRKRMLKRAVMLCLLAALALINISCASMKTAHTGKRNTVIRAAKNMLDKPYAYGSQDEQAGFDCSGLAQYAYSKAGIKIPRTSKAQYDLSEKVSFAGAEEADLLFFSTNGPGATHVGIYLGDGRFIHSPSAGKKVQIVEFSNSYWKQHFYGAGTFINEGR